jgi:DNA-binding response OmpR family regulator
VARILVVEDRPDVLQTVEMMLDLIGHDVVVARRAEDAVRKVREEPFDLLLTDLNLGAGRGTDVIAELRRLRPGTPIVAMSGNPGEAALGALALQLGAACLLQKPFSKKALEQAIAAGLAEDDDRPPLAAKRRR